MHRDRPLSRTAVRTIAPLLGGAVAAAAGVMLLGWPHRPQLPGQAGAVAATALVVVAVLLVFAPTARPRRPGSGATRNRWDASAVRPDHLRTPANRELVDRPAHQEVFERVR